MTVGIFIDGIYLFNGLSGKKFDFEQFKDWVSGSDNVTVCKYFNNMHLDERKHGFLKHVSMSGYDVHVREPLYNSIKDKYLTIGVDVELSVEAVYNIDEFDHVIIVTGSRDFLPLCEKLTLNNKHVTIVGFRDSVNSVFNKYDFIDLSVYLRSQVL